MSVRRDNDEVIRSIINDVSQCKLTDPRLAYIAAKYDELVRHYEELKDQFQSLVWQLSTTTHEAKFHATGNQTVYIVRSEPRDYDLALGIGSTVLAVGMLLLSSVLTALSIFLLPCGVVALAVGSAGIAHWLNRYLRLRAQRRDQKSRTT